MAPSTFRGAPTVTEHLYDDQGVLVRTVTASAWTPQDRALMLARQMHRDSLCSGCGQPRDTAWNPHMDDFYEVATWECGGCLAMTRVKDAGPATRMALRPAWDETEMGPLPPMRDLQWRDPTDGPSGGNLAGPDDTTKHAEEGINGG